MIPDQHSRLLELFVSHSQGTLTEADHQELQAALEADVDARKLWFLHQDLEIGLKCLTRSDWETSDVLTEPFLSRRHTSAEAFCENIHSPSSDVAKYRTSWINRQNLLITTVVLFCLSAMGMFGVYTAWGPSRLDHVARRGVKTVRPREFIVESPTHGTRFSLADHAGKLIAVHFLLKTECPFCLNLAHDYAQLATADSDVVHLFLKPDSTDEIKAWAGKISQTGLHHPPVIYRDPDALLAREFGIPDGYQFHGETIHFPALVLLDGAGKELFRYVGKDHADRMKPDEFLSRLAVVTGPKSL